jgi:hypothetical protein
VVEHNGEHRILNVDVDGFIISRDKSVEHVLCSVRDSRVLATITKQKSLEHLLYGIIALLEVESFPPQTFRNRTVAKRVQ